MGATAVCPNNDCSAFGNYIGFDSKGNFYDLQLVAGVNGPTWINNFNGDEVDAGSVSKEFGLSLPDQDLLAGGPAANNGWQQGPDPVAVANSMKQYVKAQTSNCYNGFHQTAGGKAVQSFSALALFPVASNAGDNGLALGAEILGKFSMVGGSNAAGGIVTAGLEWFTANVTTPLFALGTGSDIGALTLCGAGAATSIVP